MSATAFLFSLFALWIVVGVVSAFVMGRHGYSPFSWLIVGAVLDPLVIPVALSLTRDTRRVARLQTDEAAHRGPVDVLVGIDGSSESLATAEIVWGLLGDRIGRLTIATVVPYDAAFGGSAGGAVRSAEEALARAAAPYRPSVSVGDTVVLSGRPADALAAYATDGAFDVLAIGRHGRGASKLVMGVSPAASPGLHPSRSSS